MDVGWYADDEFAGVLACCKRFGNTFAVALKVSNHVGHQLADTGKCRFRRCGKPTQTGELSTESDMVLIFF